MRISAEFKSMARKVIVNLYGTPGAGRSTLALYLTAELKRRDVQAHFVQEQIKLRAFDKTPLAPYEFIFYQRAQERAFQDAVESGGIEVIITDAPILLSCFYNSTDTFDVNLTGDLPPHTIINLWVNPWKKYTEKGRFRTEDGSEELKDKMKDYITHAIEKLINLGATTYAPLEDVNIRPEMFYYNVQRLCDKIQGAYDGREIKGHAGADVGCGLERDDGSGDDKED